MTNFTVSLPDELKRRMAQFDYINWSSVIRNLIERKLDDFTLAERLAKKSRLTAKDLEELNPKIESDFRKEARRLLDESDS